MEQTANLLSGVIYNQAHPDPKRVDAALFNKDFKLSTDTNDSLMAFSSRSEGFVPLLGVRIVQNKL